MSSAVASIGTLLKIGDGETPTEAFTTIAEVKDISGPEFETALEEVTNHSSAGGYREYITSLKDGGEITFDCNWFAHETQGPPAGLWGRWEDRVVGNYQVVFPTPAQDTMEVTGVVTNIGFEMPVEGVLTQSVTIKLSGPPTWSSTP